MSMRCDPRRAYNVIRLTREIMLGMHGQRSLPLMPGENYLKGCPQFVKAIHEKLDRELGPMPRQNPDPECPLGTPFAPAPPHRGPGEHSDCVWLQDEGGWRYAPADVPGAAGDIALWSGQYDGRRGNYQGDQWSGFQRNVYDQGYEEGRVEGCPQKNPVMFDDPASLRQAKAEIQRELAGQPWFRGVAIGATEDGEHAAVEVRVAPGFAQRARPWIEMFNEELPVFVRMVQRGEACKRIKRRLLR